MRRTGSPSHRHGPSRMSNFKSILSRFKKKVTPTAPTMPAMGALHDVSAQEREALALLRAAIESNLENVFRGAHFVANDDAAKQDAGSAIEVAEIVVGEIVSAGGGAGIRGLTGASPMSVTMELAKKLTGIDNASELISAVGLGTLKDLYATVTPILSCFTQFAAGAKSLYDGIDDKRDALRAMEATPFMLTGDPQAALAAAGRMVDRRGNDRLATGAMQSVEAIVNTALAATGAAAVASTGVSLASKLGALAVVIHRRGIEYNEMKKGQLRLNQPRRIDLTVFGECPLLGCYLLVCSDSSSIYVSALGQGQPARGWMDQVEAAHRYVDPLITKSREIMAESLWRIEGPNLQKGLTQQGGRITGVAVDSRPWTELFLIEHFGTQNFAYRALKKGQEVQEKVGKVREVLDTNLEGKLKEKLAAEWSSLVAKKTAA